MKHLLITIIIAAMFFVGCGNRAGNNKDAEIELLRSELEELQRQLADSQDDRGFSRKPSSPKVGFSKNETKQPAQTSEGALRAYLECKHWEDRISLVVDSDHVSRNMREHYERNKTPFQAPRYFKIYPEQKSLAGDSGAKMLRANLSGADSRYIIRKTSDGYKVDWLASQKFWIEDAALQGEQAKNNIRQQYKLDNAILHVKVLRISQNSPYAELHIRVLNSSKAFLGYWAVTAVIYNKSGNYIGQSFTGGANLRPGDEAFDYIQFKDVRSNQIGKWELKIHRLTIEDGKGGSLFGGEKWFELKEVR